MTPEFTEEDRAQIHIELDRMLAPSRYDVAQRYGGTRHPPATGRRYCPTCMSWALHQPGACAQ